MSPQLIQARIATPPMCEKILSQGNSFLSCRFRTDKNRLKVFWEKSEKQPYGSFSVLARDLKNKGQNLVFAMNGGQFHSDLTPSGLLIENGKTITPLNSEVGDGNFFLKPNGVFFIGSKKAGILSTASFHEKNQKARFASQSGPMLLQNGLIPEVLNTKIEKKIRNAVGVLKDDMTVFFVVSENSVTFIEFAAFFRDVLKVQDALHLDSYISSVYAPSAGRVDLWLPLGPIVGVVK